jgi:uncharacterized protein (UPF0332 family)
MHTHTEDDRSTAYTFAAKLAKEIGRLARAIVLFGSVAEHDPRDLVRQAGQTMHANAHAPGDIDILVILDDVGIQLTDELMTGYRVIGERCARETSDRLHVTTVTFTTFWEYARAADPVMVNILRTGLPILDTGFFEPMQVLLRQGRIRPTDESVWVYYLRAPQSLTASHARLQQAVMDLYWACIDAAHAAVMAAGEVPTSPKHAADLLRTLYVEKGLLEEQYAHTVEKFYQLGKDVLHRRVGSISAEYYDALFIEAKAFVDRVRVFLPQRHGEAQ